MKRLNLKILFTAILFISFSHLSKAQSELYGSWTGYCALEKTTISSMCACGLCPTVKVDDASLEFKNIDITITDKTIKIGNNEPVNYIWDKNTYSITFQHEKSEETFKVLVSAASNIVIWKDPKSGCLIILQKKQ